MIQLYEIECANYEAISEEQPEPFIYPVPCLAQSLADAVIHIEAFLAAKHPNDRVVGGRMKVEDVFVTNAVKDIITDMRQGELGLLVRDTEKFNPLTTTIPGDFGSPGRPNMPTSASELRETFPLPGGPSDPTRQGDQGPFGGCD